MLYYTIRSNAWPWAKEFKSWLTIKPGKSFKITFTDDNKEYTAWYKVISVSETPQTPGPHVEICGIDYEGVRPF